MREKVLECAEFAHRMQTLHSLTQRLWAEIP